jgi:hypothetical protein
LRSVICLNLISTIWTSGNIGVATLSITLEGERLDILVRKNATINVICSLIKKMKKFEYSITGNDVVPQNMIGDIFIGTPCRAIEPTEIGGEFYSF